VIVAENLRKTLGGREVVNLTFHVEPGSVTGLVGPNGAGKTVTIKMISGILRKSSGKLEVFGQDPWNNPRVHERMSVIFATPFYPREIKVGELLRDLGKLYGRDPRELTEEFQLTPTFKRG
jgi:ABC-type multidrug transport system, ATPase component